MWLEVTGVGQGAYLLLGSDIIINEWSAFQIPPSDVGQRDLQPSCLDKSHTHTPTQPLNSLVNQSLSQCIHTHSANSPHSLSQPSLTHSVHCHTHHHPHTQPHPHTHPYNLTPSPSQSHTHTTTPSLSHPHTLTLALTPSSSLSHSHPHTNTCTCTHPLTQLILATLSWLGFIVVCVPSVLTSASSWFSVTNSASMAARSPALGRSWKCRGVKWSGDRGITVGRVVRTNNTEGSNCS